MVTGLIHKNKNIGKYDTFLTKSKQRISTFIVVHDPCSTFKEKGDKQNAVLE